VRDQVEFSGSPRKRSAKRANKRIKKGLRDTLGATSGNLCRAEILMRDLLTQGGNPKNIIRWTQIAREESERD
jgi:hypothetical protein